MNKVALITGSTSGIGLGIAEGFAKAGYSIMFHGLETNGANIAKQVGDKYNVEVSFSNANLLVADEVEKLIEQTIKKFGMLHILVNNAGIQYVAPIEDFPNNKYENIIAINMNAAFYASKKAWSFMKNQNFGRIINVSSVHGLRASEFKTAYVASKHGVIGMTKVLALEGAPYNITCNAICPGYVKTPLVEGQIKDQAKAHNMSTEEVVEKVMLKKQAVKEFVSLETITDMALLLAKDSSSTITGTSFALDGGWSAQ
ncbi:D-beta-hydroxybutyrate dehydrogenase [Tenacibaculum discolor]|uniref:3-hydroxybutyrate dehydrogenase n=1 Tax=Tenacibaculum discolor TaxID=361581 RepID=A0A2G1BUP4_9FLAO|nr:3-hydroxybutyrate dehydrogenase [Tenacibaculum discolor]MDP2542843.1 3-hydroxybutyrate dehydrogenase [Tenacibaculum discolor]PHN97771.1 D-beta-hydroxybutyrate dehydrogenase [Tenacibaculum discolor]PHO01913.1 D-beta-hydroxybutyrate dehydrogenase [Rhodobacteraceae bacterium 4F10]